MYNQQIKSMARFSHFVNETQETNLNMVNISFKEISKKVIVPSEQEIKQNPRARSARLRIAEKL